MSPIEDIIALIDAFERKLMTKDIQVAETRIFGPSSTRVACRDCYPLVCGSISV
jgi:hypothetical protein